MTLQTATTDLKGLLNYHAAVQPDKVALVFGDRETTYAEFNAHATQVANGLRTIAPTQQMRIASLDKNSDTFYEVLFGAAEAGAVLAPVNWRLAPAEVAYIVNDAGAEALFVGEDFFPIVTQILPELTRVRKVIALSGHHPEWESYTTWRNRQSDQEPGIPVTGSDVVMQMYTSGSTGHPKGVLTTHDNLFAALHCSPDWYACTADDVNLVCMPLYHIAGSFVGLLGIYAGARNVLSRESHPAELLRLIESERVTMMFLVPALMLFMQQTPVIHQVDLSTLRQIDYGASPIALDLLRRGIAAFKCDFVQVYGLTETTGVITALPPNDHDAAGSQRMRSCGMATRTAEIKVFDAEGTEQPVGEVGEIVVRSLQNTLGYWNLPDATAHLLHDGWLHTGDAGFFDRDGYLYVYDRVKDMIISGAENIYPAEVESALFGHPALADVAVIGVPDDQWGESVKAVVVLQAGKTATEAELIAYCRERIAHFKAPKSIDFVEELPRNGSGKLLKRVLRAAYWEGRERQVN
jgi:acyl-CoA synthetase (AMP-forming)/AMP-acid ligase II